jgi:ligand-binding SRPBCC domain-containing protein
MHVFTLDTTVSIPRPIDEVFEFFGDARNLQAITPPWLHFQILTPAPIDMRVGALIDYRIRLHWLPITWRTRIAAWEPPYRFIDEQVKGPYTLWRHEHRFEPDPDRPGSTLMRDHVDYAFFGGPLTPFINRIYVRHDLAKIFQYRRETILRLMGGAVREEPAHRSEDRSSPMPVGTSA